MGDTRFIANNTYNLILGGSATTCQNTSFSLNRNWRVSDTNQISTSLMQVQPTGANTFETLDIKILPNYIYPGNYPYLGTGVIMDLTKYQNLQIRLRSVPAATFSGLYPKILVNLQDINGYTFTTPIKTITTTATFANITIPLTSLPTTSCIKYVQGSAPITGTCDLTQITNIVLFPTPSVTTSTINANIFQSIVAGDSNIGSIFGANMQSQFNSFIVDPILKVQISNFSASNPVFDLESHLVDTGNLTSNFYLHKNSITGNGAYYFDFTQMAEGPQGTTLVTFNVAQSAPYTANIFGYDLPLTSKIDLSTNTILRVKATTTGTTNPSVDISLKDNLNAENNFQKITNTFTADGISHYYQFNFAGKFQKGPSTFVSTQASITKTGGYAGNIIGCPLTALENLSVSSALRIKIKVTSTSPVSPSIKLGLRLRDNIYPTINAGHESVSLNSTVTADNTIQTIILDTTTIQTATLDSTKIKELIFWINENIAGAENINFDILSIEKGTWNGTIFSTPTNILIDKCTWWAAAGSTIQNTFSSSGVIDSTNIKKLLFFVNSGKSPNWSGNIQIDSIEIGSKPATTFNIASTLDLGIQGSTWWRDSVPSSITTSKTPLASKLLDKANIRDIQFLINKNGLPQLFTGTFSIASIDQGTGTGAGFVSHKTLNITQPSWWITDSILATQHSTIGPNISDWQGDIQVDTINFTYKTGNAPPPAINGAEVYTNKLYNTANGLEMRCQIQVSKLISGMVASCFSYLDKNDIYCKPSVSNAYGYNCSDPNLSTNPNYPPFSDPLGKMHYEVDFEFIYNGTLNKCYAHTNWFYQTWCKHDNEAWKEIPCADITTNNEWVINHRTDGIDWYLDKNKNNKQDIGEEIRIVNFATNVQNQTSCQSDFGPMLNPIAPVHWGGDCNTTFMDNNSTKYPGCSPGDLVALTYNEIGIRSNFWATTQSWAYCPITLAGCPRPPLLNEAGWDGTATTSTMSIQSLKIKQ